MNAGWIAFSLLVSYLAGIVSALAYGAWWNRKRKRNISGDSTSIHGGNHDG